MRLSPASVVIAAAFVASTTLVSAHPEFVARIPNGANVPGVEALGHVDPEGDGPRNAFGEGFDEAGYTWTVELCQADSDGDGQTNGQELGDPCCEFAADSNPTVRWTDGVSHPGDSSLMSDPSLWATIDCSNVTATAANSSDSSFEDSSDVEVGDSHDEASHEDSHDEASHGSDGSAAGETNAAAVYEHVLLAAAVSLIASAAALW